jgi:hypothetical protein
MSAATAFRLAGEVTPTNRAVVTTLGAANAAVEATSAAIPAIKTIDCFTDTRTLLGKCLHRPTTPQTKSPVCSTRRRDKSPFVEMLELPATTLAQLIGHADAGYTLRVYARDARDTGTVVADVLARASAAGVGG